MNCNPARLASACGMPPVELAKSCVAQLDGLVDNASWGIVFLTEDVCEFADAVLDILRHGLGIDRWFGAAGPAVIANRHEFSTGAGGMAIICLDAPSGALSARCHGLASGSLKRAGGLMHIAGTEHGEPSDKRQRSNRVTGGVCRGNAEALLILNRPVAGGAVSLEVSAPWQLVSGMSQGVRDLGPWRRITSAVGGRILSLDGEPAAGLVEADTGDLLARLPDRLVRQIVVETTGDGADDRSRLAFIETFDRAEGTLALRESRPGERLRLVYRQAGPALEELRGMVEALLARVNGRRVVAALLYSSHMRGENLFGPSNSESETIAALLGPIPLIGMRTRDELFEGSTICGAAVLALIVADEATA